MEFPEIILCSSLKYKDTVIYGRRHSDCYKILKDLLGLTESKDLPDRDAAGFLTSTGRVVNRAEGFHIAKANNQIRYGLKANDNDEPYLISENLY